MNSIEKLKAYQDAQKIVIDVTMLLFNNDDTLPF